MSWLKEELQQRGVKAKNCYNALGVSHPKWLKLETDPSEFSAQQIKKMAEIMRLTPEQLFSRILLFKELEDQE